MNLFKNVHESWIPLLHSLAYREPMVTFLEKLRNETSTPRYEEIFQVFKMPVKNIKVVILGVCPEPLIGDAVGRAFATSKEGRINPRLKLIKKKVEASGFETLPDEEWKTLDHWEEQGVFLLNASLTVNEQGKIHKEWREFTETIIRYISKLQPCNWILWGETPVGLKKNIYSPFLVRGYDEENIKEIPIDLDYNYVIEGPAIASWNKNLKCGDYFRETNIILEKKKQRKIRW